MNEAQDLIDDQFFVEEGHRFSTGSDQWLYFTCQHRLNPHPTLYQALVFGDVKGEENVLCRIHTPTYAETVLRATDTPGVPKMRTAQERIEDVGRGVIISIQKDGCGFGSAAEQQVSNALEHSENPNYTVDDAYLELFGASDIRDYSHAPLFLHHLGVKSVILLSDDQRKVDALKNGGVTVNDQQPIEVDYGEWQTQIYADRQAVTQYVVNVDSPVVSGE